MTVPQNYIKLHGRTQFAPTIRRERPKTRSAKLYRNLRAGTETRPYNGAPSRRPLRTQYIFSRSGGLPRPHKITSKSTGGRGNPPLQRVVEMPTPTHEIQFAPTNPNLSFFPSCGKTTKNPHAQNLVLTKRLSTTYGVADFAGGKNRPKNHKNIDKACKISI